MSAYSVYYFDFWQDPTDYLASIYYQGLEFNVLNGLDLFTGIGGLTVALSPWVRPIAYCESDRFAQGVILSRIFDMSLPDAGIWDDVRSLKGSDLPVLPDIIYGGFPCQDISSAGTRSGVDGKRSALVFELLRLVGECRPKFVFLENVADLPVRGLGRILLELHALGYDARWATLSACGVGATHLRRRTFTLAYSNSNRPQTGIQWNSGRISLSPCARRAGSVKRPPKRFVQPRVDRTGHELPARLDRIRALGNAVVPLQAREAFKRLMGLKDDDRDPF